LYTFYEKLRVFLAKGCNMATLQQAATLTAYELRTAPELGRRKVTAQMVRDFAEPHAVAYVKDHLDEHENVSIAVKAYIDAVVDAFRMDHGVLSQAEYDAHVQAQKDAAEEIKRMKRLGFRPVSSDNEWGVQWGAQRRGVEYIIARYTPAPGGKVSEEETKQLMENLMGKQEALGDLQEYRKQYVISYKEWMTENDPFLRPSSQEAKPSSISTNQPEQSVQKKRRWW
jgi:hypothetical protein